MVPGQAAFAGLGFGHRNAVLFGEGPQGIPGLAVQHTAAGNDERALRAAQQGRGLCQFVAVCGWPAKADHGRPQKIFRAIKSVGLNILRQGQADRPTGGRVGHELHSAGQGRENLLGTGDAVKVTRDGAKGIVHAQVALLETLQLLQHRVGRTRAEGVARQQQHRQPVDMRQRGGGQQVAGPGPDGAGDGHDALAKLRFAESDGGMRHALLVVRPVGGQFGPAGPQGFTQTGHIAVPKNRKNARAIRLHCAIGHLHAQRRQAWLGGIFKLIMWVAFIIIPLLAPVAEKLGIDLIWFGVLLGANMQTSFMHPPFGFALFYLRGVAPKSLKSSDIYYGALPWVGLQLILVAIIIFIPETVTYFVDKPAAVFDASGPSVDPLAGVEQNEITVDSSSDIERQLRENK